jgi:uncharacterized protein (DUF1697 family)
MRQEGGAMAGRTFVALFSGINVGGNRMVAMADLRSMLEELGFERVSTYLQSGNAVFRGGRGLAGRSAAIEQEFSRRFGFVSRVMVHDTAWLKRVVAENPYAEAAGDPKKLHAYALERSPDPGEVARLAGKNSGSERFHVSDDVLYLFTPDGYGRSKLAAALPKTLGIACTARNWRTVLKLLSMAEAADGPAA